MNKNESKYFNTAVKMNKALIALLEKKDFKYVTIKEICETAQVNRSTFYLHYENTSDLLKETVQYIINDFTSYFNVDYTIITDIYTSSTLKDIVFITPEYLLPYLTYIKDNQRIFKTSIEQFDAMNFGNVYDKMFKHIFNPLLDRFGFPQNEREYVIKFYLMGITAVVMEWLKNDCRDSIETISSIISKCIIPQSNSITHRDL